MKRFEFEQLKEAYQYAADGGQALHIGGDAGAYPHAPTCFKRAGAFAHLIDMDADRLEATARRLGVRKIVMGRRGSLGQHIDLCGAPLRRAVSLCEVVEKTPVWWRA